MEESSIIATLIYYKQFRVRFFKYFLFVYLFNTYPKVLAIPKSAILIFHFNSSISKFMGFKSLSIILT